MGSDVSTYMLITMSTRYNEKLTLELKFIGLIGRPYSSAEKIQNFEYSFRNEINKSKDGGDERTSTS